MLPATPPIAATPLASAPITTDTAAVPSRWMLPAFAASIVVLAVLMHRTGLSIAATRPGTAIFAFVFAMLGAVRWACRRPGSEAARVARDASEYFALSTAISLVGAIASYPMSALSHGFADAALQRWDEALRFDWLAWYRFTAAHPLVQHLGRGAYALIYVSPVILLGYYAVAAKRREAYDFMASVWLAAVVTLFTFRFMPAVGPFAYLWHGPIPYLPVSDLWQPDLIPRLRAGGVGTIDPGHLVGLVSAPSFHAAAATLLMVFAARERVLRWPLIAANVAMLLSTPIEGTHYLIDLILGAIVALASVTVVRSIGRRSAPLAR